MEAFLWPPLMRGLSAVRLTGGEKTVGDRRRGGLWPPAGTPQARALNKETQQGQISYHERQRAGKIPSFKLAPARRMEHAGKHQRFPKGNF